MLGWVWIQFVNYWQVNWLKYRLLYAKLEKHSEYNESIENVLRKPDLIIRKRLKDGFVWILKENNVLCKPR